MWKSKDQRRTFLKALAGGASALLHVFFQKTGFGASAASAVGVAAGHEKRSNSSN